METKFPKGVLEANFVGLNYFALNKENRQVTMDARRNRSDPTEAGSNFNDYYYYNSDFIFWLYLMHSTNHYYYPVSFYHRDYYYTSQGNGVAGDGGISICTGGEISGGGGSVPDAVIGEQGAAFDGSDPVEIDGGDGGVDFGAVDAGADVGGGDGGDGADGGDGGGGGDGE